MIDYAAARAVAAVVQTGSFEKAAALLHVTPSAVSQRVRQLEERIGAILIVRGVPCVATEKGNWICRHMEQVGMLEAALMAHLPALTPPGSDPHRVTLPVAVNADSLGTWFMEAIAAFARANEYLINISLDDEGDTADWLRQGRVMAAVTSLGRPIQGCHCISLGVMRYHATASPDFVARYFPDGVTAKALQQAPALTFSQKDSLQTEWARGVFGQHIKFPTHWVPSTQGFLEGSLLGMGWALNPAPLAQAHIRTGRLTEMIPGRTVERELFWQISRHVADQLRELTRLIRATAEKVLIQA